MNDVLTPEQYQQLIQMGGDNAGMEEAIKQQMLIAEQMRAGAKPLEMGGNSRVQVAPSWLQLAGNLAQSKVGYDKQAEAAAGRQTQAQNTTAQNQMLLQALMKQQQMQQPQGGMPAGNGFRLPGM